MTDKEVRDWAISEYNRSLNISNLKEAKRIRYRTKIIFDKRFPNLDICLYCGQKIVRKK